ncbi:MAG: 23S rRNA (adenine(2503)-C(2))-methyltransferase RlmN [Firmicutes bacterium]|uniref:Probable dual-specificity RNA methyltransferase RlmN n=1 Tax=Candidatus Scybalomonas excrementavium TaxID=2840943 RepID=A0A9D9N722_9FIRM|nr:23S rRNA (adenine(2503)-C(2))-methyltransferase RlmN [Candidatus Scybalomonas excrementavium]
MEQNVQYDLKSLTLQELEEVIEELGEKKFRAKQIYGWIHQKLIQDLDEMVNVPKKLREQLKEKLGFSPIKELERLVSNIDGTSKFIFALQDGSVIESVLMKYKHGNSVCVSSQVGCRMGCRFCASTLDGLSRNLLPSEILDQIYYIQRATKERVSNIVLMGTGEPFDNYENVMRFLDLVTNENGLNLSQRNITISTCGLVPKIKQFADRKMQCNLAISLHSPTDEMRKELMPIAKRYTIDEILEACQYFFEQTGRRITFEYSLVAGVNDKPEHAKILTKRIKNLNCHVNLIPVNPIKERDYKQSNVDSIMEFKAMLERNHINATVRREMGRDIQAACGQLRRKYTKTN